jgi:superoxide reductase
MSTKSVNEVYKCSVCGNIVQVLFVGGGTLICCEKEMVLQDEKIKDEGLEKHVPVVEQIENGYKVTVGSVEHPMEEDHHIQWIELIADGRSYRKYLNPGDKPEAEFCIDAENVTAREYCNLHGQWISS